MSRPKRREVRLILTNRDPSDREGLLQAIEDIFRPSSLLIISQPATPPSSGSDDTTNQHKLACEPLETQANQIANEALEQRARENNTPMAYGGADRYSVCRPGEVVRARHRTWGAIRAWVSKGYEITVAAIAKGTAKAILDHLDRYR